MHRRHTDRRVCFATLLALGLALNWPALAVAESVSNSPASFTGIVGEVADQDGNPLNGVIVSIFGATLSDGAVVATTDEQGQFEIDQIPPGLYRLRAYLNGFLPSQEATVIVTAGMREVAAVAMRLVALAPAMKRNEEAEKKLAQLQWLLRHSRRHILQQSERYIPVVRSAGADSRLEGQGDHGFGFPVTGEVGILAAGFEGVALADFPGSGAGLDSRVAFARIEIPTSASSQWLVQAQVLESALASWAGAAEYQTTAVEGHDFTAGVRYGKYLYGDLEGFRPPEAAFHRSEADSTTTEWFGGVSATDRFRLGKAAVVTDFRFDYFDYLTKAAYASPGLELSYPIDRSGSTTLHSGVQYRVQAPGGEDMVLLSRMVVADVLGARLERQRGLRAQSTRRYHVGIERLLGRDVVLAVRAFQEDADDQLVKAFTNSYPGQLRGGRFALSNRGQFRSRGLGVELFRRLGSVEGSVGYTYGVAKSLTPELARVRVRSSAADDTIHDLTTTLAAKIDRTNTRLQWAYRLVHHPGLFSDAVEPEQFDSRFNLQVHQALPFVGGSETEWELMLAIRNLFYDDLEATSFLDELSVIDAPRRVVGGVTVRF